MSAYTSFSAVPSPTPGATASQAPVVPLDLALRVGCQFSFESFAHTPVLLGFKPRQDLYQMIRKESLSLEPLSPLTEFEDDHGNIIYRHTLQPGHNLLRYDAIVMVPSLREDFAWSDEPMAAQALPPSILRYTLPTRYCDSDKLLDFAWEHFGQLPNGLARVRGICEWLHHNIEYRSGSGSPNLSAFDVIERRFGVCRDLAHTAVALCRTFNLPARYVSGYVPDIGSEDPGTPMDFHAYMEVYLGGRWQVFDARFNTPRIGRVRICAGDDASTCAFATLFGSATLSSFYVWSYQVDPNQVSVDDPVDLSKRLCGTPEIRYPQPVARVSHAA